MIEIAAFGGHGAAGVPAGAIAESDSVGQGGPWAVAQGPVGVIVGAEGGVDVLQGGSLAAVEHVQQGLQGCFTGAGVFDPGAVHPAGQVPARRGDDGDFGSQGQARTGHTHTSASSSGSGAGLAWVWGAAGQEDRQHRSDPTLTHRPHPHPTLRIRVRV